MIDKEAIDIMAKTLYGEARGEGESKMPLLSAGPITDFNLAMLSAKGSLFATRPTLFTYIANRDEYNDASYQLYSRIADGRLKVAIHDRIPLEKIVDAHNLLEGRKTKGGIVITL